MNFQATAERIARLEDESGFRSLADSKKKAPTIREQEIAAGERRQEEIRALLRTLGEELFKSRDAFLLHLRKSAPVAVRLSSSELKAELAALSERDETAEICRDAKGNPEPDAELRDTETVPLKESIEAYFQREVLPHVPTTGLIPAKPRSVTKSRSTATFTATNRRACWK